MSARSSYDEVPYASYPYPESHPDRLATVATLLGLRPASVEHCRVLELGTGSGGNIIPMAEALPESSFHGIDLSEREIAEGARITNALGLANLDLRRMDIMDVGHDLGEFDYILCHGVYSWVPATVQEHILTICRQNLAVGGVAYVSYNTLPGWNLRSALRDMMLLSSPPSLPAQERIEQVRGLLTFLAKSAAGQTGSYHALLRTELDRLGGKDDDYLLHEYLEEHNQPCYFFQFMERATAKGLRYLGDGDVHLMAPSGLQPEGAAPSPVADAQRMEQYMDFLRNRTFRRTLLCHAEREPRVAFEAEPLAAFWVAAPVRPASPRWDVESAGYEKFHGIGGAEISSRKPIVKAALLVLAEAWPQPLPFVELLALARARLRASEAQDADKEQLAQFLLRCYATASSNLVELSPRPLPVAKQPGARPRVRPLARRQASVGSCVTNLKHRSVILDEMQRLIVQHLDGQRDRAALVEILHNLASRGELSMQGFSSEALEKHLDPLARLSLLVE
jgi:methyltransferase-like protein